jgi:CRISPR/Cas system-associated exonuclease Cas4 (RecB family)
MSLDRDSDRYNPAQRAVVELLGRTGDPVALPAGIGAALKSQMEELLAPVAAQLDLDDPLWVTKHDLATVHGCEAHHLAAAAAFEWSVPTARGSVVHRAIQLGVNWTGEPSPAELVDEAIARLVDEEGSRARRFLGGLSDADRADLRSGATDLVTKFLECFPPLRKAWAPVTESRVVVELFGGALVLSGKTDLTLGRLDGTQPRKVIIDLKSGRPALAHRDDLRYYALLVTCRLGIPPRKVASYYLDAAQAQPEDVSEALLQSALHRTVDGVVKIVELTRSGRSPVKRPGWVCRWCPLVKDCPEGQAELLRQEEDGDGPW